MRKQELGGILIVAYYYPPTKAIGTLRNYNVALEFDKYFERVHVLSTSNADFLPSQALPTSPSINSHKIKTFDFRSFIYWLYGKSENLQKKNPPGSFTKRLLKLKNSFPFNIFLDEGSLLYIINGFREADRIIQKQQINYIYSSYRPYADHLIAWLLKLKYPQLTWIADFRDPFVDLNFPSSYWPKFQLAFNKFILKKADHITTVSQGLVDHFSRYERPVYLLRNGFNPQIQNLKINKKRYDRFTMSYTGSIYPERQSIRPLLLAVKQLVHRRVLSSQTFQLVYAGKDKAIWDLWIQEFGLEAFNRSFGQLSLEEAISIQHNSHMNLLMTWSGPHIKGILTGKLYEYLIAQKPIIGLVNGQYDSELEEIFSHVNAGQIAYEGADHSSLSSFIQTKYLEWFVKGEIEWQFDQGALQEFNWTPQMQNFIDYLTGIPSIVPNVSLATEGVYNF